MRAQQRGRREGKGSRRSRPCTQIAPCPLRVRAPPPLPLQLYGLLVAAPSAHYWQAALERIFPNKSDPLRSLKKVSAPRRKI